MIPTLDPDRYVLVTGASGYVGHHVATRLAAKGHRVAGTCLTSPIVAERVDPVTIDLSDGPVVARLLRDMRPAAIVHCAAATSVAWCQEHPAEARAAILDATTHLCAARERHTPGIPLIALSTDLVFDGEEAPYHEDAPAKPLNLYGSLKSAAEKPVLDAGACVLRSALVYGPPAPRRSTFLGWMKDTLEKGDTLNLFSDEYRTPVLSSDLCAAVELLLAHGATGIFHAGGTDRLSRVAMGRQFCQVFSLSPHPITETLRADSPGGELRARDVSLATPRLQSLGWKPKSFKEGLEECRLLWS